MDPAVKEDVQRIIKSVLGTFTLEYGKAYAVEMAKDKMNSITDPPPHRELDVRNERLSTPLKEGYLVKEGNVVNNWKKRYFVINPDYSCDYWETKELYEEFKKETANGGKSKKKPKGSFSPAGYSVIKDLDSSILARLEKLATTLGMDVSKLPKPKTYPKGTFELHHYNRRCYYVYPDEGEDRESWLSSFETASRNSLGFLKDDPIHHRAFPVAARATRWKLGRWGYWGGRGTEEQILSDMISDELEYETTWKVYSKIPRAMPYIVKNTMRKNLRKVLDAMVMGAVKPAWGAMWKVVEELRVKIKPAIEAGVTPAAEAKLNARKTIQEAAEGKVNPVIDEKVTPTMAKGLTPLVDCMTKAKEKLLIAFTETTDPVVKGEKKVDDIQHQSWWKSWEARQCLYPLGELLDVLREFIPGLYVWSCVWRGQDAVRNLLDNALFTFKVDLQNAGEGANVQQVRDNVIKKLTFDTECETVVFAKEAVLMLFNPVLLNVVQPIGELVCKPISDALPDAVKQFIDPVEEFMRLVENLVGAAVEKGLVSLGVNTQPRKVTERGASMRQKPAEHPVVLKNPDDVSPEGATDGSGAASVAAAEAVAATTPTVDQAVEAERPVSRKMSVLVSPPVTQEVKVDSGDGTVTTTVTTTTVVAEAKHDSDDEGVAKADPIDAVLTAADPAAAVPIVEN